MIDRYRDGYIDRYTDNACIHKDIDTQMIDWYIHRYTDKYIDDY